MNKVSIVIPSSPKPSIFNLLQSLKGQKYDEIIIEMLGSSPAQARNIGAKKVKEGNIIVFLDDDVIVAPNFLENGLKTFLKNKYDFAQSKVVGSQENSPGKFIGTAMWFTQDCFNQLTGFCEDYSFFNEDIDIYLRGMDIGIS